MTGEELPHRQPHRDQPAGPGRDRTGASGRIWPASSRFLRPWGNPGFRPKTEDSWSNPDPRLGAGQPTAAQVGNPVVEQRVLAQLVLLRNEVAGVDGSLVATSDGLLVVQDLPNLEPSRTAALIATTLSIARQATQLTERGLLREAVIHGSSGYLAVFAVGDSAVLAVIGGEYLNVGMLHYQTRAIVKRIEKDAEQFPRFASSLPERLLPERNGGISG
jgi:predicted regulator of Ras-like GTPase activity (Roadblock/LC7/MglB family)